MKNTLEQFAGNLNEHFFLQEYSFGSNRFRAALTGQQLELVDHIVALPDALFVFQIKERNAAAAQKKTRLNNGSNRRS